MSVGLTAGPPVTAADEYALYDPITFGDPDIRGSAQPNGGETAAHLEVCLVGAGPRGLSVLERLCAQERKSPRWDTVTVHVVDPDPPGSGRVWRPTQSRHLLMNTVSCQVTVYTDASVRIDGPLEEGPSLYEWAKALVSHTLETAPQAGYDGQILAEARRLGPDSYPTRALYGCYLTWAFQRVLANAAAHVTVRTHPVRAVALHDDGATGGQPAAQTVVLEDGTRLTGLSAVVLAQGHVPAQLSGTERELTRYAGRNGLTYLPPSNPADADLSGIRPGEHVLLRGLGLNFFDYLALFTHGRGGVFTRAAGRLRYRPSGREPRLYAGSRRGVPYQARGENEKGAHGRYYPRLLTAGYIAALRAQAPDRGAIDFAADLWPLVSKEVCSVHYATLLAARGELPARIEEFTEAYLEAEPGPEEDVLLEAAGIHAAERWDWKRVQRPYGDRVFPDQAAFRGWLRGHLDDDVRLARQGNVSGPVKAALDVLRDLRNELRLAVDHAGLTAASHRDDLDGWYTPLNAYLSIGPPASRIEEMAALIDAGILEVTGPGLRVDADPHDPLGPCFTATSSAIPDVRVRATVLIEARLPEIDLKRTADPLMNQLLRTGQCHPYRIPAAGTPGGGTGHETGGLAVTERPYHVIDVRGLPHPRRFAYGVPTESVHWVTAAGIRPGVGSVTLEDSDAIAAAVLALPELPCPVAQSDTEGEVERMTSVHAAASASSSSSATTLSAHLDAGLLSPVRAGTPVEAAVGDSAWLQAMLDAEAALARAQARCGTVPAQAAAAITAAARADLLDVRELALAARETANPVVGLVKALTAVVAERSPQAAEYVHRGSTSQDVFDTGAMLVAQRALRLIVADLRAVAQALAGLAATHRDTVMAGRTLALHAVPTTFGLKAAGWRGLVLDAVERLERVADGGLPVALGGAAGTLAGYLQYAGRDADPAALLDGLSAAFADETGLAAPLLPWHALRTPVADLGAALAHTTGALGKIAADVLVLTRTEVAEVAEGAVAGRGASSAMPHKRNPVLATLIRSAALQVPALATVLMQCLPTEDERSAGMWHAEWQPLREALRLTGGAAHTAVELARGLTVDPERMRANLRATGGQLVSERVSAVLAPRIGKTAARELLAQASLLASRTGLPLADVLAELPQLAGVLSREEAAGLLDPATYTGVAGPLVDRALTPPGHAQPPAS